jgi:hypothetical protein
VVALEESQHGLQAGLTDARQQAAMLDMQKKELTAQVCGM